jgi:hypothetical protein
VEKSKLSEHEEKFSRELQESRRQRARQAMYDTIKREKAAGIYENLIDRNRAILARAASIVDTYGEQEQRDTGYEVEELKKVVMTKAGPLVVLDQPNKANGTDLINKITVEERWYRHTWEMPAGSNRIATLDFWVVDSSQTPDLMKSPYSKVPEDAKKLPSASTYFVHEANTQMDEICRQGFRRVSINSFSPVRSLRRAAHIRSVGGHLDHLEEEMDLIELSIANAALNPHLQTPNFAPEPAN